MKAAFTIAGVLLAATSTAAENAQDCMIQSVRERVLAEQSGGPQRATEEGEAAPSATDPAVLEVVIACGQKKYFAVFTRGGRFDRADFDTGHAVRVHIDDGKIRIENRKGTQTTGWLTAER